MFYKTVNLKLRNLKMNKSMDVSVTIYPSRLFTPKRHILKADYLPIFKQEEAI